jgi:sulfite oxidase
MTKSVIKGLISSQLAKTALSNSLNACSSTTIASAHRINQMSIAKPLTTLARPMLNSATTSVGFNAASSFHSSSKSKSKSYGAAAAALGTCAAVAIGTCMLNSDDEKIAACAPGNKDLPEYTASEVAKHKTKATGIWVTFDGFVYDITDFIESHPGGSDKIVLAAGGSVEPFWGIYTIHKSSKAVKERLEEFRIGRLNAADAAAAAKVASNSNDPYCNDPSRHPALQVLSDKPFNAEVPNSLIAEQYITPNDLWFVRQHHPVPKVNPAEYTLEVGIKGKPPVKFSLQDLKTKFKKHSVTATLACAGNRRDELNELGKTEGLRWKAGALSTAVWSGVLLRDILHYIQVNEDSAESQHLKHVIFASLDLPFDASIPIEKALNRHGDCLLAYEMNGVEIPRDHGYPVRAVVPGTVGARNAKWVHKVTVSDEEAVGVWQRGVPYRGYSANVKTFKGVNVEAAPPVQELPVQSAIASPSLDAKVTPDSENLVEVKGWAWSGGGRGIVRVDVSGDGGKTWKEATITHSPSLEEKQQNRAWAWTLWTAEVAVPPSVQSGEKVQLVCRAVDYSYNTQPEHTDQVWNLRGILNNAWHRVNVEIDK